MLFQAIKPVVNHDDSNKTSMYTCTHTIHRLIYTGANAVLVSHPLALFLHRLKAAKQHLLQPEKNFKAQEA